MATDDIIPTPSTDELLNERLQNLLNDPNRFKAFRNLDTQYITKDDEFTRALEIDKLTEYGFNLSNQPKSRIENAPSTFLSGRPIGTYDDPRLTYEELNTSTKTEYGDAVQRGLEAGDPYFFQSKFIDRLSPRKLGEFYGIDYDSELPNYFLYDYSNLPNNILSSPTKAKPVIERLLRDKFGNMMELPDDYDFDVKSDPSGTVGFTFQNPINGKRQAVNPPGLQFGLGEGIPFVAQLTAEIGAGIAGTALGSLGGPTTAISSGIIAEGLASYTYKYQTLKNLQDRGILPAEYNINREAMKELALVMGLGLTSNIVLGLLGRSSLRVPGLSRTGALPGGIDDDEFIEAYEEVSKEIGDNNLISISNLTTPQVVKAYDEIRAERGLPKLTSPYESAQKELEQLASGPLGGPLRAKFIAQADAGETAVDDIFETGADLSKRDALQEGTDLSMSRTGTEVREATEEFVETAPNVIIAKNSMDDFIQRNSDEFKKFMDGGLDVSPAGLSRNIQEDFYNLRVAKQKETDDAFNTAFDSAGVSDRRKKPFEMNEIADVFEGILSKTEKQIFPSGELVGIAKRAVSKIKGTDKVSPNPFLSREAFDADFEQVRRLLSDAFAKNDMNAVRELEQVVEAFEKTRYDTLLREGGEGSTQLLDDALDKYKVLANEYKSGVIGEITNLSNKVTNALSSDSITASNKLLRFINSGSTITDEGFISSPAYLSKIFLDPDNAKLVENVRLATKNNLFENVFEIKNGRVMPKEDGAELLRQWKNNNASVLDEANGIFNKKELQSFDNVDALANRYRQELEAREVFLQKAKDNVDIKVITEQNLDNPEIWFSQVFEPNNVTKPAKLFEAVKAADNLTGNTQLMDKVKLAIYDDFMKNTSSKRLGTDVFDAGKIEKYLSEHGSAMGIFLGDRFVVNLGKLNRQLKTFLPAEGQIPKDEDRNIWKAAQSLTRAYVGLFTRPGRFLTAANYLLSSGAERKSIELTSNPDELYRILTKRQEFDSPKGVLLRRILGIAGGEYMIMPEETPLPDEEVMEETKRKLLLRNTSDVEDRLMKLKYNLN